MLVGAGCAGGSPSPTTSSNTTAPTASTTPLAEEDRAPSERTGDTSKTAQAKADLGIALPPDAGILTSLNNANTVAVSGRTALSVNGTSGFFTVEMAKAGYQIARSWGVSPLDNETSQSASFRGNGETWSFNVRAEGGITTFDIQRQR